MFLGQASTEASTSPTALERTEAAPEQPGVRRLFLHGGRIHLGDGSGSVVEALLVEDGRVIAAGTEKALGSHLSEENLTRIDLKGSTAVPGFQDAHSHVLRVGQDLAALELMQFEDRASALQAVRDRAAGLSAGEWIVGTGLSFELFAGEHGLDRAALTEAAPKHPVYLRRVDGHAALVNDAALELAELQGELDPPPRVYGGRVVLDDESYATGELLDEATRLFDAYLQPRSAQERRELILAAQAELLAQGWTCVHDMGADPLTVSTYEELLASNELKLRIVAYFEGNAGLSDQVLADYPRPVDELGLLSVPGVLYRLDGALSTHAAALIEDYTDAPGQKGQLILTEEQLTNSVHKAWQASLQPAVTAVGDRANRVALDVYERMLQVDEGFLLMRPRIEHAQLISTKDFPRFPGLEITPSMQPAHAILDDVLIEERLGEIRSGYAYGWRNLAPGLGKMAFGSDVAAGVGSPLVGIHAARTRRRSGRLSSRNLLGQGRLDGRQALAGFTSCPAYAVHQDESRGRLSPGYWADVTILDVDPTECAPDELLGGRVLLTLVNGEVVYRR